MRIILESRLTIVSRRGQEEAAIVRETKNMRPLSELFTRKTIQKIATALTKPP